MKMIHNLNIPKHFIVSRGVLREKNQNMPKITPPTKIDYQHTVRVIGCCKYQHQHQITLLKAKHRQEIQSKQKQIAYLKKIIQMKTDQTSNQETYIDFQQKSRTLPKQNQHQITVSTFQSSLEDQLIFSYGIPTQSGSFLQEQQYLYLNCLLPDTSEEVKEQILKVKNEMHKTEDSLKQIAQILRRERKKYVYFDSSLQKTKQNISYRELQHTKLLKNQLNLAQQYLQSKNCSLLTIDETQTDQNQNMTVFMQQLLNQHHQLKILLIELQEATRQQMQNMKIYYQNQISDYIKLLNIQKNKNETLGLNYPSNFLQSEEKFDQIQHIEVQSQSSFQQQVEAQQHLL